MPESNTTRFAVRCPGCRRRLKVPVRHAGRQIRCPDEACQTQFRLPKPSGAQSAPRSESAEKAVPTRPEWMEQRASGTGNQPPKPPQRPSSSTKKKPPSPSKRPRRSSSAPPPPPVPRSSRPLPGSTLAQQQRAQKNTSHSRTKPLLIGGGLVVVLILAAILMPEGQDGSSLPIGPTTVAASPVVQRIDDGYEKTVQPFLTKYCGDCHSEGIEIADVDFDRFPDDASLEKGRHLFEKVIKHIHHESMPPSDAETMPTRAERDAVIDWLDRRLFRVDCELVDDPGRVTIRRLNRAEYNNTIRDLFGIEIDLAKDFPSDDVGEGFDNNGDVLSLPPLLLEKYLSAAETITEKAILPSTRHEAETYTFVGDELRGENTRVSDAWHVMASTGEAGKKLGLPIAGRYRIEIEVRADQAGNEDAKAGLKIDGQVVRTFNVKGNRKVNTFKHEVDLSGGQHEIAVRFLNDFYNPKAKDRRRRDRNLYLRSIELTGPLDGQERSLPQSHRDIIFVTPSKSLQIEDAARQVLGSFARRAWRRPVGAQEVDPFVRLVKMATGNGDSFERGIQLGVQGILISPHFLFRVETDPNPDDPNTAHRLRDFELASRLSYFLWSSMPDDELFRLAERDQLHDPGILEQQVRRMLADPKADALVENFAAQWLNLRTLDELNPDRSKFKTFDDRLRHAMQTETKMLFSHIMREDRSILEFLDADYTFLNEQLAKHYGLDNITGDRFRKVSLLGTPRRGVLTHASILSLTSNPDRTSPVKRGKWILENILGDAPPEAPPNVPALEEAKAANPDAPLKEQLALHRENGTCAACHKVMDPIGFGFENFDATGRWRTKDGGHDIDPAGELPSGERFSGPIELLDILKARQKEFSRTLTERMLVYALGRGLYPFDLCAVDDIQASLARNDYRFSALVTEIVLSRPFRMRRGEQEERP